MKRFFEWWIGPVREPYTWLIFVSMMGFFALDGWKSVVCVIIEFGTIVVNLVTADARRSVRKGAERE